MNQEPTHRCALAVPIQGPDERTSFLLPLKSEAEDPVGGGPEVRRETGRGKDWFKIRDHFADERCTGGFGLPRHHGCWGAGSEDVWGKRPKKRGFRVGTP